MTLSAEQFVRVEFFGTLDELNVALGEAHRLADCKATADIIDGMQGVVLDLTNADTSNLKTWAEKLRALSGSLRAAGYWGEDFIRIGGTHLAVALHECRVRARKAGRWGKQWEGCGDERTDVLFLIGHVCYSLAIKMNNGLERYHAHSKSLDLG